MGSMAMSELEPDALSYADVVTVCETVGEWEMVLEAMDSMVASRLEPLTASHIDVIIPMLHSQDATDTT